MYKHHSYGGDPSLISEELPSYVLMPKPPTSQRSLLGEGSRSSSRHRSYHEDEILVAEREERANDGMDNECRKPLRVPWWKRPSVLWYSSILPISSIIEIPFKDPCRLSLDGYRPGSDNCTSYRNLHRFGMCRPQARIHLHQYISLRYPISEWRCRSSRGRFIINL